MNRKEAQESSPSLLETAYDVPGVPLPAFQEPYIFPKYITDEVRELSLLQLVPDLAEAIVSELASGSSAQETFDAILTNVGANEFDEVRRRVFQNLPTEIQLEVEW
jgi:hypothetical protein